MKDVYQLVKLLERTGQSAKSIFINFSDENSLETKLYRYLQEESLTDEEATKKLYGDSAKKGAFKMLKSRFKKKLFNQLLFLNHDHFNNLRIQEIQCNKILLEADVLVLTGDLNLAKIHVLQGIKLAKEASLTNSVVWGLEIYRKILSGIGVSLTAFNDCQKELDNFYKIQQNEREATYIHNEISLKIRLGVSPRLDVLDQLKSATIRLKQFWEKSGSPKLFWQYHKLKMLQFELSGNFLSQIDFIKKTDKLYYDGLIHPEYFPLNLNRFALVYALLRCKKYQEGILAAEEFKVSVPDNSLNWFSNMENYFLLHIHNKKYLPAGDVLKEVFSNESFTKVVPYQQENWLLLSKFYQILSDENLAINKDIKIETSASKDKKGYNIWVLIHDFLSLLKKGKHELLQNESERIRKYMSKHLDSKSDPRVKMFLKLLLLVVKEEFDPVRCKQKSRYLYNKLAQTPPAGDAYAEVEVVPFEHLWEFILEKLAEQKVKSVKY